MYWSIHLWSPLQNPWNVRFHIEHQWGKVGVPSIIHLIRYLHRWASVLSTQAHLDWWWLSPPPGLNFHTNLCKQGGPLLVLDPKGLQRQLDALSSFYNLQQLTINLGKIMVTMFNGSNNVLSNDQFYFRGKRLRSPQLTHPWGFTSHILGLV